MTNKPQATIDGKSHEYDPAYIAPELLPKLVYIEPEVLFALDLKAVEIGVLIFTLASIISQPAQNFQISAVLEYFNREDELDILEIVIKLIDMDLIYEDGRLDEKNQTIRELKKILFDGVLYRKQAIETGMHITSDKVH